MWAGRPGPIHPRNAHGADMPLPSKKQFKETGHR